VDPVSTCWTVIRGAAAGRNADREEFARRYVPVVRGYLAARWRGSPWRDEVDDAAQEVFLACFREGGALAHADPSRDFRAFLFGVARNIARRVEKERARRTTKEERLDRDVEDDEEGFSTLFDRAWALSIMREAAEAMRREDGGPEPARRAELLRLRFHEGMPIREIARAWNADAAALHHEYARARAEFREALVRVVAFHHPAPRAEVERECGRILALLAE
jgi:RNA polymerase sigma-70 factor (ECF subfamily)